MVRHCYRRYRLGDLAAGHQPSRCPRELAFRSCSLRGLNPRPMAHKTIALTTELREPQKNTTITTPSPDSDYCAGVGRGRRGGRGSSAADVAVMGTLAEWLRRWPAKPMGSPCVGSNPTGLETDELERRAGVGVGPDGPLSARGRKAPADLCRQSRETSIPPPDESGIVYIV